MMTEQDANSHFKVLHCCWRSIEIWGLVTGNKIYHLSFDRARHEKLCSLLITAPLSVEKQEDFCAQLFAALKGRDMPFPVDSPLIQKGTPFQQRVWRALHRIPFGQTRTYGDIARELGNPRSARAVGQACNKNPLPIIISCHRVVSVSGPGGFAGGSQVKKALLDYEQEFLKR